MTTSASLRQSLHRPALSILASHWKSPAVSQVSRRYEAGRPGIPSHLLNITKVRVREALVPSVPTMVGYDPDEEFEVESGKLMMKQQETGAE